jgi:hypothetical protein
MGGYSGLKTPLRSTQKFLPRDVVGGGGGATRPSAALAPSAPAAHRILMRCSRAARSMSRASARSSGAAAFGRAGAFGGRLHLHFHAIVSSRAVQSRASARSQALDATCVSRQNYVVHGDASFCAERKIPLATNIAGTADKVTTGFREQMPRRPEERLQT